MTRAARWAVFIVLSTLAGGLAGLVARELDGPLERLSVDARFSVRGPRTPSDRVVLIAYDNRTLRDLNQRLPLPREQQARVIDVLDLAGAAVVAFDYSLEGPSDDPEADRAIAQALMDAGRAVVSVTAPNRDGSVADLAGTVPFAEIAVAPGWTLLPTDPDGTIRRFPAPPRGVESFAAAVASAWRKRPLVAPANALIDFPGPADTVPRLSYIDVLNGTFDRARVNGRVAVIASTASLHDDVHPVAVDGAMPGGEIQADAIATALDGFPLRFSPSPAAAWLASLAVALLAAALLRIRRAPPVAIVIATGLAVSALWTIAAQVAFDGGRVVEFVPVVVAIAFATAAAAVLAAAGRARERRRARERFAAAEPGMLEQVLSARARRGELSGRDIVAGYDITEHLATGGMGTVYSATQLRLGRAVALKLIRPEAALDSVYRRRFVAEAHVAAGIAHPNIVPVIDAGESDGLLFIAMQLVDGADLGRVAPDARRRGAAYCVRVLHRVACALDAAHDAGLVHRDVKPSNILVPARSPEHPYLTDFGVARTAAGVAQGSADGTRAYLAPERSAGVRDDAAGDIYALAVVLYELLTGVLPFAGADVREAHRSAPRPAITAVRADIPAALDAIVAAGMAIDPDERPARAGELTRQAAAALGVALLEDDPIAIAPGVDAAPRTITESVGYEDAP